MQEKETQLKKGLSDFRLFQLFLLITLGALNLTKKINLEVMIEKELDILSFQISGHYITRNFSVHSATPDMHRDLLLKYIPASDRAHA